MPDQTVGVPADMLLLVMHDLICQKIGMKFANAMHATHTRRANSILGCIVSSCQFHTALGPQMCTAFPFETTPLYLSVLLLQHHRATSQTLHHFRKCTAVQCTACSTSVNKDI